MAAIVNNGLIIFNNAATIDNSSQFQTGPRAVSRSTTVRWSSSIRAGIGTATAGPTTGLPINDLGTLRANFQADDTWDGAMYINGGRLFVSQVDHVWGQSGG